MATISCSLGQLQVIGYSKHLKVPCLVLFSGVSGRLLNSSWTSLGLAKIETMLRISSPDIPQKHIKRVRFGITILMLFVQDNFAYGNLARLSRTNNRFSLLNEKSKQSFPSCVLPLVQNLTSFNTQHFI